MEIKRIESWQMHEIGRPMKTHEFSLSTLAENDVVVRVSGCGVCHTDLGFFYDGVRTVKQLPLTLGHEISGFVEAAGSKMKSWINRSVIVPAVLPCGECDLCKKGKGTICRKQRMPGNHIDGGFASHVVVPGSYLCPVDVEDDSAVFGNSGVTLKELSVIADAVTTPFQAIRNSKVTEDDTVIFIGVGGIGSFGVQIAKALGANVVAIDVDDRRLEMASKYGADVTFNPKEFDRKTVRKSIQSFVAARAGSQYEWKIFETSGTKAGQELAFGLLTFGSILNVVGFTMDTTELRLSNLMAFDARAIGNWGCHPKYYPDALELVRSGKIKLGPFVQTFPMSEINVIFERVHHRELHKRPILVPDFV